MCIESIASLTNFSKEVDRFQVMDFCNRLVHFFLFFFFFFWSNCQQLCTAFHILRLCFNVIYIYAVVLSSSFYKLFQWILWLYAQYFMWYICIYRTGKNIILETKTSQKWRVQFFRFKPCFWKKKKNEVWNRTRHYFTGKHIAYYRSRDGLSVRTSTHEFSSSFLSIKKKRSFQRKILFDIFHAFLLPESSSVCLQHSIRCTTKIHCVLCFN